MFSYQYFILGLLKKLPCKQIPYSRHMHLSIIGAANDIGSNLALLCKNNKKITRLHLYDDDERINGVALELSNIPGGPDVEAFAGDRQLGAAVRNSHLVTIVNSVPRRHGTTFQQMIIENAPSIQKTCKAIADYNSEALIALSTDPMNSMVPFASALLSMYNSYNPFKVFGITHIDTARARAYTAKLLEVDPRLLQVPVIGGHSDNTIVPLFSNVQPTSYAVNVDQADMLTRLLRRADKDVMLNKQGTESATLSLSWSIHEFVDAIADAVLGKEAVVNAYSTNLLFGTRYFSGPVKVGPCGITASICDFNMNDYERDLLRAALPIIHEDVSKGEEYVGVVKSLGRYYT